MKITYSLLFFFWICSFPQTKLESRQYNLDYLVQLVEDGNQDAANSFFSDPKYVSKVEHIIEFAELFRTKLEAKFGYKPTYREAYNFFKDNVSNMNLPKRQEKAFLAIFKEVTEQHEKSLKKGYQLKSVSMDFRGSLSSDDEIPQELAIAFTEALSGCLLCVVPSGISQMVGGGMIIDAGRRTYDYLEKIGNSSNHAIEPSFDQSYSNDDNIDRGKDRDSWDREW